MDETLNCLTDEENVMPQSTQQVQSATRPRKKILDLLFEQLIGIRNILLFALLGIAGQSSGTDLEARNDLAARNAYVHLAYGIIGNFIFFWCLFWKLSGDKCTAHNLRKTFEKLSAGKNLYLFFSFWLSIAGGIILRQMLTNSEDRENTDLLMVAKYVLGLSGYLTGFDASAPTKSSAQSQIETAPDREETARNLSRSQQNESTVDLAVNDVGIEDIQSSTQVASIIRFRALIDQLAAFRKSLLSASTATVVQNGVINKNTLVRDNAVTDLLFGSMGVWFTLFFSAYGCSSSQAAIIGKRKMLKLQLYGKPLQLALCFILSLFAGAILISAQKNNNNDLEIVSVVLSAMAGYFMGAQGSALPGKAGEMFTNPMELHNSQTLPSFASVLRSTLPRRRIQREDNVTPPHDQMLSVPPLPANASVESNGSDRSHELEQDHPDHIPLDAPTVFRAKVAAPPHARRPAEPHTAQTHLTPY